MTCMLQELRDTLPGFLGVEEKTWEGKKRKGDICE